MECGWEGPVEGYSCETLLGYVTYMEKEVKVWLQLGNGI